MVITGKELQRLSYKLCQEVGEEDNLELLNRVALFLYYEHHALGLAVDTDIWRIVCGRPTLFDTLPKYAGRRKGRLNDWHWTIVKDKYPYYLERVKFYQLITNYYPTEKLEIITGVVASGGSLQYRELLQISFYALHV